MDFVLSVPKVAMPALAQCCQGCSAGPSHCRCVGELWGLEHGPRGPLPQDGVGHCAGEPSCRHEPPMMFGLPWQICLSSPRECTDRSPQSLRHSKRAIAVNLVFCRRVVAAPETRQWRTSSVSIHPAVHHAAAGSHRCEQRCDRETPWQNHEALSVFVCRHAQLRKVQSPIWGRLRRGPFFWLAASQHTLRRYQSNI